MAIIYSVDSGVEYLRPFAKRLVEKIHREMELTGRTATVKDFAVDSSTLIHIESYMFGAQRLRYFNDRVRITGGGGYEFDGLDFAAFNTYYGAVGGKILTLSQPTGKRNVVQQRIRSDSKSYIFYKQSNLPLISALAQLNILYPTGTVDHFRGGEFDGWVTNNTVYLTRDSTIWLKVTDPATSLKYLVSKTRKIPIPVSFDTDAITANLDGFYLTHTIPNPVQPSATASDFLYIKYGDVDGSDQFYQTQRYAQDNVTVQVLQDHGYLSVIGGHDVFIVDYEGLSEHPFIDNIFKVTVSSLLRGQIGPITNVSGGWTNFGGRSFLRAVGGVTENKFAVWISHNYPVNGAGGETFPPLPVAIIKVEEDGTLTTALTTPLNVQSSSSFVNSVISTFDKLYSFNGADVPGTNLIDEDGNVTLLPILTGSNIGQIVAMFNRFIFFAFEDVNTSHITVYTYDGAVSMLVINLSKVWVATGGFLAGKTTAYATLTNGDGSRTWVTSAGKVYDEVSTRDDITNIVGGGPIFLHGDDEAYIVTKGTRGGKVGVVVIKVSDGTYKFMPIPASITAPNGFVIPATPITIDSWVRFKRFHL